MGKNEKSLPERIADIEDKINYLIYSQKQQNDPELSEGEFKTFYTRVEKEFDNLGVLGGLITMNSRFANVLKHKVLYPDYETGYWYPTGKTTKDIPVDFRSMRYDYAVEMLDVGDFHPAVGSAKGGN